MPRQTYPPPERKADVVLERRYVAMFGRLLAELGVGDQYADAGLLDLLERASREAHNLRERTREAERRAGRLQAAAAPIVAVPNAHQHHVQYRAIDADEGVVIPGSWVPDEDSKAAQSFMIREIGITGRDDLTVQKLVRCSVYDVTSVAREDDEPPF